MNIQPPVSESDDAPTINSIGRLPVASTRLIGREREIDQITQLLQTARLVTLTGPGGCGKTRLAVAAAEAFAPLEHGAWFVDLSGLDDASLVTQVVATTLGVPETRGRTLPDTLTDYLRPKQLLVILDNCEHLLSACADLAALLLDNCPRVRVLATSREPLGLSAEAVWLVPSLNLPEATSSGSRVLQSEAVQLFMARATAVLPGFNLDDQNAATIAQICRRLDGIPLAIELAAVRVKLLDVEQIAARVDDSLQLLTRNNRGAAPRHQTMRAALDWGYRLLSPREQALFWRLAVFAGSFTLEAAEAVCADGTSDEASVRTSDILDELSDLVDKSLVAVAERGPGEEVRYRLLEPIRQYALDRLREADEEAAIRDQHLAYAIVLAEAAEPNIRGENQLAWLKRLDKEHDNLRAALAWGLQAKRDAVGGLRLAQALYLFWQRRGYWSEGRRWLQQAVTAYDARPALQTPPGNRYLAYAIVAESWLAYHQGDYGGKREALQRGLQLAQALDDPIVTAYALGLQAQLTSYAGNLPDALPLAEASVASARRSGDRWTLAWADYMCGMIVYRRDEAAARAALSESVRLFRDVHDKRSIAMCLNVLGYMTANAGQLDKARSLFEEALAIGYELDDKNLQITELSNLAHLARLQGDISHAAELYEQVLAQARDLSKREQIAGTLEGLGHTRLLQGDLDAAHALLRESLQLYQQVNFAVGVPIVLSGLGRIAAAQGRAAEAARVLGAVEAFLTKIATRLDADQLAALEQNQAAVRAALSSEEFNANYLAGHDWTLEQASQAIEDLLPRRGSEIQIVPTEHRLQLCALGPARVFSHDQALTNWPYARVKELLFYLISHPARTKAQIGLDLWPDASPKQLRNSLGITLYHLRRTLGNAAWIIFEDEVYRFNRALNYQFDVDVFEANLAQAQRAEAQTPDRAIALLQSAVELYQGDYVEDFIQGEWFLLRRENLRRKYLAALLQLGGLVFARHEYARAAETYRLVIEKDNVQEAAHRELMRCYARLNDRNQALRHYQTLEEILRAELGAPPAPESVALHEQLLRGEET